LPRLGRDASPYRFFLNVVRIKEPMKKIQILGTGCSKCKMLLANAEEAVKALGLEATIEKVEKIQDIMKFGVMTTPALVVDGQVKSAGKALSTAEIEKLLK
jgi:small redox-active disulfide protein 2